MNTRKAGRTNQVRYGRTTPRVANADARKIVKYAEGLGYEVSLTGGSHLKFFHPITRKVVIASGTPRARGYAKTFRLLQKGLPDDHPSRELVSKRT